MVNSRYPKYFENYTIAERRIIWKKMRSHISRHYNNTDYEYALEETEDYNRHDFCGIPIKFDNRIDRATMFALSWHDGYWPFEPSKVLNSEKTKTAKKSTNTVSKRIIKR